MIIKMIRTFLMVAYLNINIYMEVLLNEVTIVRVPLRKKKVNLLRINKTSLQKTNTVA